MPLIPVSFRPPTSTVSEIRYRPLRPQRGVVPWAVQRALNTVDEKAWAFVQQDGVYGKKSQAAVKRLQNQEGLLADGVVGAKTSLAIADRLLDNARLADLNLPRGLVRGIILGESSGLIGAINATVAGGIDCGYCQRRVYAGDYGRATVVKRAFDGQHQFELLGSGLRERHDRFFGQKGARTHAMAWKLAALHHNYPIAAQHIASLGITGLSSYYRTPQDWVMDVGYKFDDGTPVRTPLEWCQFYSLGRGSEKGNMVRFVEVWPS